jgi:hypothetical protein
MGPERTPDRECVLGYEHTSSRHPDVGLVPHGLWMLTDVIPVTCQKSRHSGYCKWSVNAYCPDTIGT